jgi:dihydrofolate synthase/folylpolyglutamate synthase
LLSGHRVRTYEEILSYLFAQLPMYQRVGAAAYKEGLDGIITLCERLGNPQKGLKFIHVAGTNGKGSTSHFLASIFQEAGFTTGLYTSPHLVDFRERIKVNGEMVSKEFVIEFTERNKSIFEELQPSFFEMTVAMCFEWFAHQKTDLVILEVGMGGRLDSTNIITPEISIITNIGLDHMKFLGDSIEKIAEEKAGIIKPNIPVVISEITEQTLPVFKSVAEERNAPIIFAEDVSYCAQQTERNTFFVHPKNGEKIAVTSPLSGHYQEANICGVYAAFQILKEKYLELEDEHFSNGISQVIQNTGLHGRWETLREHPTLICDIGHNAHGFKRIMDSIHNFPHENLVMVLGFVNDKDLGPVLTQLPQNAQYVFTQSSSERSIPAGELAQIAHTFGLEGHEITDVGQAVQYALENAKQNDLIFLGGSTFVVADYLARSRQ